VLSSVGSDPFWLPGKGEAVQGPPLSPGRGEAVRVPSQERCRGQWGTPQRQGLSVLAATEAAG